jgi:D-sedoheptulose 7-phosphate isomerase
MIDIKEKAKQYLVDLKTAIDEIDPNILQQVADVVLKAYKDDKTVFIFGNGGSASTASHMACDWGKGTLSNVYDNKEKRLRVISLTDNVATMTAVANDLSYDEVFMHQLKSLVRTGDIVIGISGSGNSPNVIKAFLTAKEQGAITIGFLGFITGGKAQKFVDLDVTIQSNSYGIVEDLHLVLNHLLTECLSYMKKHSDSRIQEKHKKIKKTNLKIANSKLNNIQRTV